MRWTHKEKEKKVIEIKERDQEKKGDKEKRQG